MIQLEQVTFTYDKTTILDHTDFIFKDGNLYVIIVQNNKQKQALLTLFSNQQLLDTGNITYKEKMYCQQEIGIPDMTIQENLTVLSLGKLDTNYDSLLSLMQLEKNKRVKDLTADEKQKLAIISTNIQEANNKIFHSLEVLAIQRRKIYFQEFLQKQVSDGQTILVITEQYREIISFIDALCFLQQKQIVCLRTSMRYDLGYFDYKKGKIRHARND